MSTPISFLLFRNLNIGGYINICFVAPPSVIRNTPMFLPKDLFAVLGDYRDRLQRCQTHLKDGTRQLQVILCSRNEKLPSDISPAVSTHESPSPCLAGVGVESRSHKEARELQH